MTFKSINEVFIKWQKDIDNAVFGEIKQKATEHGISTEYFLNEKAIISALEKQIPKKPNRHGFDPNALISTVSYICPACNRHLGDSNYCPDCGQALDWGDSE